MKTKSLVLLSSLILPALTALAVDPPIWIEAEKAAVTGTGTVVYHNPWFDSIDPSELSGGAWVSSFSEKDQPLGMVTCAFKVPQQGTYHFWIRCNTRAGLGYRVDKKAWEDLDFRQIGKDDQAGAKKAGYEPRLTTPDNIAADAKFDGRFIGWVNVGKINLESGSHEITFRLGAENGTRCGAVDCFVLSRDPFTPNGKYKPGEKSPPLLGLDPARTWAFAPATDAFSASAGFDLRALNEKQAGEHGFIKLSKDGSGFVRGDGQPIRFWGGSDYTQRTPKMEDLEHHARFLAKRGVNIARWHGDLTVQKEGSKITDVNEKELDEVFKLVAAMKKEGIYTIISPYWGSHTKLVKSWGVPDSGNGNCSALVFFDPVVKAGYKERLKVLYTKPNPHTGIPLSKDPAVAIIQLQNEDSMLFWTMQGVKGEQLQNLRKLYAAFLVKKYGSLEKTRAAWKNYDIAGDDWAGGLPGMFIIWEFTKAARDEAPKVGKNRPGWDERLSDQFEFMVRTMYDFNAEIGKYLREELHCPQLVNAGNWRSGDPLLCDEGERWSYTANEVLAKNHYFDALHTGINVGWQILAGQTFANTSATREPDKLPINIKQVVGHPFAITESLWVPPNIWQSEGPLIVAAQSALTGMGPFFWFADGVPEWENSMRKWTYATPVMLGQFPAASLIYRLGYVKPGPVVVHEERSAENTWHRATPLLAEGVAYDPNRDAGDRPVNSPVKTEVDPLAFLVGRVEVAYNGDPSKTTVMDLSPYVDRAKGTVRAATGETAFDMNPGVFRVNAPKAQGAAGFLKAAGPQSLTDVDIACANEYASIVVVPLDDQPIQKSARLLVQAGTVTRLTDWSERPQNVVLTTGTTEALRIVNVGKEPFRVEKTDATVTIRNASLTRAVALDPNGMPLPVAIKVEVVKGGLRLKLPPDALYVLLTK